MNKQQEFSSERQKTLIITNELTKVLEELSFITKGKYQTIYNEILIHLSNYNQLRREIRMNIVESAQSKQAFNQLKNALIELIDDLETLLMVESKYTKPNETIQITINDRLENFNDTMREQLLEAVSKVLGMERHCFMIEAVYSGSVKVIISIDTSKTFLKSLYKKIVATLFNGETDIQKIQNLIKMARKNPEEIQKMFGNFKILDITSVEEIHKRITLSFYRSILNNESVKWVFTSLTQQSLAYDFKKYYLKNIDLRGINLSGYHLNGADLTGANLSVMVDEAEKIWRGTNLSNADLSSVNLSGANLNNANLNAADLSNAILVKSNLTGVNLKDANLKGLILSEEPVKNIQTSDTGFKNKKSSGVTQSKGINITKDLNPIEIKKENDK